MIIQPRSGSFAMGRRHTAKNVEGVGGNREGSSSAHEIT
jgi:hypothetical protein